MKNDYVILDTVNTEHKIYLVKNINDKNIYVKKDLNIFNYEIYNFLLTHQVEGAPKIKELEKNENGTLTVYEEYIPGNTLEALINKNYVFSEQEIINVISSISTTLMKINNYISVVHRDIKPSNVILYDGKVYLLDFNAAKISNKYETKDTVLIGTEGYAAPEQYGFGSSTIQTDIYSIGILAKELSSKTKISKNLQEVIDKCSMLDPKDRYKSYKHLLKELRFGAYNKYLPVGFRNKEPSKMILSSLGHIFLLAICLTMEIENSTKVELTLYKIGCAFMMLSIIAFSGNYLNILDTLKITKIKNGFLRVLVIILIDNVIAVLALIPFVILADIFK